MSQIRALTCAYISWLEQCETESLGTAASNEPIVPAAAAADYDIWVLSNYGMTILAGEISRLSEKQPMCNSHMNYPGPPW